MELFREEKLWDRSFRVVEPCAWLEGRVVGLYFSASWSPPCQEFTPILAAFHREMMTRQAQFQIVYLPFDKSEEDMREYIREKHGNWLSVPFKSKRIQELRTQFAVKAVPKLVIVKPDGEVVTYRGRKEVADRGVSAFRPWSTAVFGVQPSTRSAVLESIGAAVASAAAPATDGPSEARAEGDSPGGTAGHSPEH